MNTTSATATECQHAYVNDFDATNARIRRCMWCDDEQAR